MASGDEGMGRPLLDAGVPAEARRRGALCVETQGREILAGIVNDEVTEAMQLKRTGYDPELVKRRPKNPAELY